MNKRQQQTNLKPAPSFTPVQVGILQRKCACGNHTMAGGKCTECAKKKNGLQRKLAIGSSHDPLEREADRVADQVLAAPAHSAVSGIPPRIQRFTGQATGDAGTAPSSVDHALASSGRPLEPALRQDMEQRFGYDFSRVRVHSDTAAEQSSHEVNAHAYTVGHDIVFGACRFAPGTNDGKRLLAHELTHVVQQSGVGGNSVSQSNEIRGLSPISFAAQGRSTDSVQTLQRDLATPPPAVPAVAQPDLTPAQIKAAIAFNRARYNETSTRLIQDLLGGPVTGVWTEENIEAIAATQNEYGFKKDGMVGPEFFRFLDEEVRREKLSKTDKNCLLAFRVISSPQTVGPVVGGSRSITGNFLVRAQFSKHCGCADYEYRQFIRGHWRRERAGVNTDLGGTFTTQPAGRLNAAFDEDGNTAAAALNYGHRNQPDEAINHYLDDTGAVDQANGCIYESEDTPGGPDTVLPGDIFDIDVNFRGEIQRTGRVVRTLHWSAIRGRFPVP